MGKLLDTPNPYLQNILKISLPGYSGTRDMWAQYETIFRNEGMESAYRWTSFLFSGDESPVLKRRALEIWESGLINGQIKVAPEISELCEYLNSFGWEIYIVTASPTLIIQAVSSFFSIPPENVLGMNLEIQENIVTPEIREPFTFGSGKVSALKTKTPQVPDLAFGDSQNDEALLLYAKQGFLLSRGNRDLEARLLSSVSIQPGFE